MKTVMAHQQSLAIVGPKRSLDTVVLADCLTYEGKAFICSGCASVSAQKGFARYGILPYLQGIMFLTIFSALRRV